LDSVEDMLASLRHPRALLCAVLLLGMAFHAPGTAHADRGRVGFVVIDAGHGGDDLGAVGRLGVLEKDVALRLAGQLGKKLELAGVRVTYTRGDDSFVSLAERTTIANMTRADLYISLHVNASKDAAARGPETYFLSVTASDDEAYQVALTENEVFKRGDPESADIVGSILGELIRSDHMLASSKAAAAVQRELAKLPGPSRGVKQAPFVVLSGVNMPAVLLEIGFLTNPEDERNLNDSGYRDDIANAIVRAISGLQIVDRSKPDERAPESARSNPRTPGGR
jgi:N-acetylmuramoyl-L-alanine amidase